MITTTGRKTPTTLSLVLASFLFLTSLDDGIAQSSESILGYWTGGLVHRGVVQSMSMDVSETADGLLARISVPERDVVEFPRSVTLADDTLSFGFFYGRYKLVYRPEYSELSGYAESRSGERRSVQLKRATRPVSPRVIEEEISFQSRNERIAGSILVPDRPGPHPAVIFVQGRSYGSRWGNYSWALTLARHGVATLIFDGRGSGESEGTYEGTVAEDRFADAAAAIALLQERDDIDSDQIGLWGISAGGWVVPEAARRSGAVAFLVLDVGPSFDLAGQQGQVVSYNMRRNAEENGFAEADFEAARTYQERLVELSWEGAEWSSFEPLIAEARTQPWADFVDLPDDLNNSELDYYRRRKGFDPAPALRQTTIPVLAFYGEADYVVPDEENAPRLRSLLTEAGNTDFQIVVMPEADHGMNIPELDGEDGSYRWPRQAPGLGDTILDWILEHVRVD